MNKQIERIKEMEELLDESRAAIDNLSASLRKYITAQKSIKKLEKYYTSKEWLKDFEDDEKGKLPDDLKRGVLSEELLDNLLNDNKDILEELNNICQKYTK